MHKNILKKKKHELEFPCTVKLRTSFHKEHTVKRQGKGGEESWRRQEEAMVVGLGTAHYTYDQTPPKKWEFPPRFDCTPSPFTSHVPRGGHCTLWPLYIWGKSPKLSSQTRQCRSRLVLRILMARHGEQTPFFCRLSALFEPFYVFLR